MSDKFKPIVDDFNKVISRQSRGPFKGSVLYQNNKYRFGLVDLIPEYSNNKWVKAIDRRKNTQLLYNFNYNGQLYLAEIPILSVSKIVLMKEPFFEKFGIVLAHTQLCTVFDEKIILYPQNENTNQEKIEINSFIYSYNFVGGVKDVDSEEDLNGKKKLIEQYSPLNGLWLLRRRYLGSHNIFGLDQWIKKEKIIIEKIKNSKNKNPVRKSPTSLLSLDLYSIDHEKFVKDQLLYGHTHNRLEKRYETVFRNCGNIILRNIYPNINAENQISLKARFWHFLAYLSPIFTDRSLFCRGVKSELIDIEELSSISKA